MPSSAGWRRSRNWRASTASHPEALPERQAELSAAARRPRDRRGRSSARCARSSRRHWRSYQELARQLSARRTTAARALAKEISARMQELGMGGGRFLIDVVRRRERRAGRARPRSGRISRQHQSRPAAARDRQSRLRRRAGATVAGGAGVLRRQTPRAAWCSTRSTPASAARSPRSSAASCASSASAPRCCA